MAIFKRSLKWRTISGISILTLLASVSAGHSLAAWAAPGQARTPDAAQAAIARGAPLVEKQPEVALKIFEDACRKNPGKGALYYWLAQARSAMARHLFVEAAKDHEHKHELSYRSRMFVDATMQALNQSIKLDPGYAPAYVLRSRGYALFKQYSRMVADLKKALELDPANADALVEMGNYLIGQNKRAQAILQYTAAIKANPRNYAAYYARAKCYAAMEQADKAIADLNTILHVDEKFAAAYLDRGRMYQAKRDYNRAIADFTAYIKLAPKDAQGYAMRRFAYALSGKPDLAARDCAHEERLRLPAP